MSTPAPVPSVASPAASAMPLTGVNEDEEPGETDRRAGNGNGARLHRPRAARNTSSTTAVNGDLAAAPATGLLTPVNNQHHSIRRSIAPTGSNSNHYAVADRFWPAGTSATTNAPNDSGVGPSNTNGLDSPFNPNASSTGHTVGSSRRSTRHHDHGETSLVDHNVADGTSSGQHHHHHYRHRPDSNNVIDSSNGTAPSLSTTINATNTAAAGVNRNRRSTVTRGNYLRPRNSAGASSNGETGMDVDDEMSSEGVDEAETDIDMN
jgi:hypothetical protein